MKPLVLALLLVLVLAGCAPSRQDRERRAREDRLQQRLAVCDQEPTFPDRFDCWSTTIKESRNASEMG